MEFIAAFVVGLIAGGAGLALLLSHQLKEAKRTKEKAKTTVDHVRASFESLRAELENKAKLHSQELYRQQEEITKARVEFDMKVSSQEFDIKTRNDSIEKMRNDLESKIISHALLTNENQMLKRDLLNLDLMRKKLKLDTELNARRTGELAERTSQLCERYLKDVAKWVASSVTVNNFAACKKRLVDVVEWCRDAGYEVSIASESELIDSLKREFELVVRNAMVREEQAKIKAQIREEERVRLEIEREQKRIDREKAIIEEALSKAMSETKDQHSAEIESLRAQLAAAEERQRAVSQAQLTKSGHIYVISNIGSFGDGVFKIGMTRRLEPMERIKELGDASVPFPFDVHMMISTDNAPTLENDLHRAFHLNRVNKVNPRKEYFKVSIEDIIRVVEKNHGKVDYIVDAEALEFRQGLSISDEDVEYIEDVFEGADPDQAMEKAEA